MDTVEGQGDKGDDALSDIIDEMAVLDRVPARRNFAGARVSATIKDCHIRPAAV